MKSTSSHGHSRTHSHSHSRSHERQRSRSREHKHHKSHSIKIYISNIPSSTLEEKVKEEFSKFGEVIDYSFKKKGKSSHYYGYIKMKNKNEAKNAIDDISKNFKWKISMNEKIEKKQEPKKKSIMSESSSENSQEKNKKEESTISNIKSLKVRELWIGNLPQDINEQTLYKYFFMYGEITKIEINYRRGYAFIRYKLVKSASVAYEKSKNKEFNGKKFRMLYSDSGKRNGIIGDEPGFVLSEKTCKLIHVSLNKGSVISSENIIREVFGVYGKIKEISQRNFPGYRPSIYIEYIKYEDAQKCVEDMGKDSNYENRKKIGDPNCDITFYFQRKQYPENIPHNNINNMRPFMLVPGNVNSILYNPIIGKIFPPVQFPNNNPLTNNPIINNNTNITNKIIPQNNNPLTPNINNTNNNNVNNNNINNNNTNNNLPLQPFQNNAGQALPFIKNPQMANNFNTFPILNVGGGNSINQMQKNLLFNRGNMFYPTFNPQFQNQSYPQNIQMLNTQNTNQNTTNTNNINNNTNNNNNNTNTNITNTNITNTNNNNNNMANNTNNNTNINAKDNTMTKSKLKEFFIDIIKDIMPASTSNNESEISSEKSYNEDDLFEKDYSLEEENLKNIWSGFLTKNKKDRISVDIYLIRGNISDDFNSEYNLNVSHRTQYEEIVKRPLLGIVAFSPQNITQCEGFNDYINYFNEKQRVGVINIKSKFILYLVPPCDFSRKFYQNPKKHLLGILVDSNIEPKMYVDMNNLSLPPPVISSTEKKLLMKKKNNK